MKQKKDDKQSVTELLKQLQASYLGTSKKAEKKSKEDEEDEKFRKQLAAMLGKATDSPKKKAKKKASAKHEEAEPPSDQPLHTEPVTEQLQEESVADTAAKDTETVREPTLEVTEDVTAPVFAQAEDPAPEILEETSADLPIAEPPAPKKEKKARKPRQPKKKEPMIAPPSVDKQEPPVTERSQEPPVATIEAEEKPINKADTDVLTEALPDAELREDETLEESETSVPLQEAPQDSALEVEALKKNGLEEPASKKSPKKETHTDSMIFLSLRKPVPTPPTPTETGESADSKSQQGKDDTEDKQIPQPLSSASPMETALETPSKDQPIVIKPPVAPPSAKPAKQATTSNPPIRIIPKVTLPTSSNAPDFSKKSQGTDHDSIVIRPHVKQTEEQETIVIRPRTADKPKSVPQLHTESPSAEPIKIGKEINADSQRNNSSVLSETIDPSMKKEKNVTLPPVRAEDNDSTAIKNTVSSPTRKEESTEKHRKPATAKREGVSLPKATPKRTSVKQEKKKPTRVINSIPVTTLSDDGLEEVLDEALPEELLTEEIPMDAPEEQEKELQKTPPLQRRRLKRSGQDEQELSALELVRKKSGLSDDDIAMIFELGYETELGRLVGYENLKRLKSEHLKKNGGSDHRHYRTSFGYRGEEFVDTAQADGVRAAYLHDRKHLILRLCLTALLALLALFADFPMLIGARLTDLTALYPLLLPIVGILLSLAAAALSYKQIRAGLRSLFKFTPTPYSVPALLLPAGTLYSIAAVFASSEMLHINCLICAAFLVITVCDVLRIVTEMRVLKILSSDEPKAVLAPAAPRKKKLRQGDKIVKIINDDLGKNMYQVRHAEQTTGFFRRFNTMQSAARPFTVLLAVAFSLATLAGFAVAVITSSLSSAISAFITVLLLSAPLPACFLYFYPISRANKLLSRLGCALLGNESVEEYEAPKTLIFYDVDLYTAEKCTEIAVREGDDFKNDLRLACILFRKLGGTLKRVGESVPALRADPPVSVVRIQDAGVEAMIDNRYHMLVGNAEFLKRGGVRVPRESTDKILRRTPNVSLMYVAIDGVLKLSYEIEYRTDPSFEELIRELADVDASVAIYSYDPNLNETFLQKSRPDASDPISAIKPGRFEEEKPLELADTGAVALGNCGGLVHPIYAAKAISNLHRFGWRLQLIAALLAALLTVTLALLGQSELLGSLQILAYQLLWFAVSTVASMTELSAEKLKFRKK